MKNYDQPVEINHNPNWLYTPNHLYRILIIDGSGSRKTNVLLNLIKHQRTDTGKIYLYVKDPFESKYQLPINGSQKVGNEIIKIRKAFIDYSQTMGDVYGNFEDYNPREKRLVLIVFDAMMADMESNKILSPIFTELFLKGRKLNNSFYLSHNFISKYLKL